MTTDEVILHLRRDPQYADLIRDAYLEANINACAERFLASAEFAEVLERLRHYIRGGKVLDLGAGNGIGSYALAKSGPEVVYALEPDPSEMVGQGAIRHLSEGLPIRIIEAVGEEIPLPDGEIDLIYARQVLHHARDLHLTIRECARVLRRGGVFFASREHVVDDERQLKVFLAHHPVHRMVGGEHAFPLTEYTAAIRAAGLRLERVFRPYDTIINAFPEVKTAGELDRLPQKVLIDKLGPLGAFVAHLPGVKPLIRARLNAYLTPGRMYSFLAIKS